MKRGAILLALALGAAEAAPQESEVDRLLRAATTGRTVVRPQAARRLVRHYEAADAGERRAIAERLRREAGDTPAELARLGSALVEVLGSFDDDVLRRRLWAAFDDPDFPWRPYAARSLAGTARGDEAARYERWLTDPIAPVREAGVAALGTLGRRASVELVRARLADEDGRVRRAAADQLVRWGEDDALWWLFEELGRSDRFFDRPTGEQARFAAAPILERALGGDLDLDPGAAPESESGREARARLEARLRERAGERPSLPAVARASGETAGEVIGLELRSCRKGEFFLRWTADDRLLVGLGRPVEVPLPAGSVTELAAAATAATGELDARLFGAPGCDVEHLLLRGSDGTTDVWIVSKGPDPVDDLRPARLSELFRRLVAALPDASHQDPRLDRLRSRAAEALVSIGG